MGDMADYYLASEFVNMCDSDYDIDEDYREEQAPFKPRGIVYSSNQSTKKKSFAPPDDDFLGYYGF